MDSDKKTETRSVTVDTVDSQVQFTRGCSGCHLVATSDCYVAFDENADSGSFLIKANIHYDLSDVPFTQIHTIRTGGAATLHILAIR